MTDKEFCELYSDYTGGHIDSPRQLGERMTGYELKEWTEFVLNNFSTDTSEYKVGDRAVIVERINGHEFSIGENVEVVRVYEGHYLVEGVDKSWCVTDDEIKHV
jgi:hypothetical protein